MELSWLICGIESLNKIVGDGSLQLSVHGRYIQPKCFGQFVDGHGALGIEPCEENERAAVHDGFALNGGEILRCVSRNQDDFISDVIQKCPTLVRVLCIAITGIRCHGVRCSLNVARMN